MKTRQILFLPFLLPSLLAQAQLSPFALTSGGGSGAGLSFSIGQAVAGGNGTLNAGFQQNIGTAQLGEITITTSSLSTTVAPGGSLTFTFKDRHGRTPASVSWECAGGSPAVATGLEPKIGYALPGTYSLKVTAVYEDGSTELWEQSQFVTVAGIAVNGGMTAAARKPVLCQGQALKLSCNQPALVTQWSTGQALPDIEVSAPATGWYSLSMTGGLRDSIYVEVRKPIQLGVSDTSLCAGQSLSFDFTNQFKTCQWNDAPLSELKKTISQPGTYTARVSDMALSDCFTDATLIIREALPLPIFTLGRDTAICEKKSIKLSGPAGMAAYRWATGETARALTTSKAGRYTLSVTGTNGCANADEIAVSILSPYPEPLGIVTADPDDASKMLIAWNRSRGKRTARYVLYREGTKTGAWDSIATVGWDAPLTIVTDSAADPGKQAYRYKLSTIDSVCGNRAESSPHRSILLRPSQQLGGGATLTWNRYEGSIPASYYLYRKDPGQGPILVTTIAGNDTDPDYSRNDPNASSKSVYQVRFDLQDSVYPRQAQLKTNSGPYGQSLSNLAEITLDPSPAAELELRGRVSLYPQPAFGQCWIAAGSLAPGSYTATLLNAQGAAVSIQELPHAAGQPMRLALQGLAAGTYTLRLSGRQGIYHAKIAVVK